MAERPHVTIPAPQGRPCWVRSDDGPLIYLGWGKRDFARNPVARHCDVGTNLYLLLKGDAVLTTQHEEHRFIAPRLGVIDPECLFGLHAGRSPNVEILVWVWREPPGLAALRPPAGGCRFLPLHPAALPRLLKLHQHCRTEIAHTDPLRDHALPALRALVEVELARAAASAPMEEKSQWDLVRTWIQANLSIHAPVPALCDYLRLSPSSLNRFFLRHAGCAPGVYFRAAKKREAERLIGQEGWTVKATAYHLGYRHATDLSRVLGK